MARDFSAGVRQALVDWLNNAASQTHAILDGRAYGPSEPDNSPWPFARLDLPTVVPRAESCSDVQEYTLRIHGFTKGADERGSGALGNAIVEDLDGFEVALPGGGGAYLSETVWTGTQHLRDTVAVDGWHAAVSITCRVDG